MYAVTNRIKIQKGNGDHLEEVFGSRGSVQYEPGFKSFELWSMEMEDDHEIYLVVTRWENKSDFLNWTKSESFSVAHKNAGKNKGLYIGHPIFEGFEVIL